jgi:hypothetical protein
MFVILQLTLYTNNEDKCQHLTKTPLDNNAKTSPSIIREENLSNDAHGSDDKASEKSNRPQVSLFYLFMEYVRVSQNDT